MKSGIGKRKACTLRLNEFIVSMCFAHEVKW